jgi:N-terminal acetyltransferase B complex catalytic subunit
MLSLQESPTGRVGAYMIGKAEGAGAEWHGHVSAVTVAPEFRRLGLARKLCRELERVSEKVYNGYFVDLFVRASNSVAVRMYGSLGYATFRRVLDYYGDGGPGGGAEDALDMRRPCARDIGRASVKPLPLPITARELNPLR